MKRQVCWTERLEDGEKRDVRVTVANRAVRWQHKHTDWEKWEYDFKPSRADWDALLTKAEGWYRRKKLPYEDLERVRKGSADAGG